MRLRRALRARRAPGGIGGDEGVIAGITHFRNGGGDGALIEIAADSVAQREGGVLGLGRRHCRIDIGIIHRALRAARSDERPP